MRTLLLLGGSEQQVIAIDTAKRMGLKTVLCDYLPDNPGQFHSDVFYPVSTTDKDAVLDIARKENVDGIVAYASDPAAPTAAYVAEQLELPGLPFNMALNFCEKDRFRSFLEENGFAVPASLCLKGNENIEASDLAVMHYPLITKPTDSSGSKGVSVVESPSDLPIALDYAREYSRGGNIVIEEFVERNHPHVIEAELTVDDGKVITWGLINSIRDESSNPLLPAAYSYPLELPDEQLSMVKDHIDRLVMSSGMMRGSFNIEMIIDKHGRLFFLDAGPRNGGNMLPDFISLIAKGSVIEATIQMALGDSPNPNIKLDGKSGGFWGLVVYHSNKDGIFEKLEKSPLFESRIIKEYLFAEPNQQIHAFTNSRNAFGLAFLQFDSDEEKRRVMNNLSEHVRIVFAPSE